MHHHGRKTRIKPNMDLIDEIVHIMISLISYDIYIEQIQGLEDFYGKDNIRKAEQKLANEYESIINRLF